MRLASIVTCVLIGSTSVLVADTYPRQQSVDAIHYRFSISVSDVASSIDAEATATFRVLAPIDAIELDLVGDTGRETASQNAARSGMHVKGVLQAGKPVAFTHAANRLRLPVPSGTRPGDELTYAIAYEGTPSDGLKVLTNMHGERVLFSEGWPNRARHWLPVIDHPYDKATGEMIVTTSSKWQVVSNGVLVEEVDVADGRRRTHWRQSVPIASWLFAIGVARFDAHHAGVVQGIPLQTWAFPQDRVAARDLFEETSRRAIDFFSSRVGPYPFEKLANVQATGFGGGMENATVIFYGEKGVASGRGPVVHEIAHQWFGNSVTERDWDDVWLSEGFATYFALLYREQFEGREAFVDGLQRSRDTVLRADEKLPGASVIHRNLDDMQRVLNDLVYQKGGWVLHMLRREVGDDQFWRGMQAYYRRYRDGNASTDDFRKVMEEASGRDLRGFFVQWLTRSGCPKLDVTWRYDSARKAVALTMRQAQPGEPYSLTLDVEVLTPVGRQRHRVALTSSVTTVSLRADYEPSALVLDPETSVLAEIAVRPATARAIGR
jgi:aminopeptidase N